MAISPPRTPRRFPRVPVSVSIKGRWRAPDGQEADLAGLLSCLSEGGASLNTAAPITANSVVRIKLKLGLFQVVEATGRVRWWRRRGEVRQAGIEFREPQRRIGAWVEKQLAARNRRGES
jgi:hypothetical protein